MRRLALFVAAVVPALAQVVTIPASEISSWGSPGPCPTPTWTGPDADLPPCEIYGPEPSAYGWLHVTEDAQTITAYTVVTVSNIVANTSRITTILNDALPDGFTMPDTNSDGTRVWTVTYFKSGTPETTVMTYPTPFVDWPDFYRWSGDMTIAQVGGNGTSTQCVHQGGETAIPLPAARYLTEPLPITETSLFPDADYAADPYGLNHGVQIATELKEDPYFVYSSFFPGEPPLSQCTLVSIFPVGRGGRWPGNWFIETTSSVSYEDETTTTTTTTTEEEAVTTSSESGRVIVQLPTTSTDSPSPSPPPPPSSSTRQDEGVPTSTEGPRSSVPTASARVELPSTSDGSAPTPSESPGRGSQSKTQAPTTMVASETTVVSGTAVISETTVSSQISESQTMIVSQNSVPQTTVGLQILVSETTVNVLSSMSSQTATTQRINNTSTELADATTTTVDVVQTKPVVLIPVVRATLVKTAEDGSVETVVAFVPDETAMSSTRIDRFAKYLKPGAQVHAAEETAAEETAVVQSTDGDAKESTIAPVTTYRSWSLGRPAPAPDPIPDPVASRQAAGGVWHRPDWALMMVLAMVLIVW